MNDHSEESTKRHLSILEDEKRAKEKLKRIPVIILTSSQEEQDRAKGYDNYANSYLIKPISFEGFLKVVKKIEDYWITLNVGPPNI
jgi:DNA-binding response OmpR family regulator